MKRILQITLCFVFLGISVTSNAQLINFEETWKAFLDNNKTSNISKLPQPPANSIDFPKYCLMYANSAFCFNKLGNAQKFMQKIEDVGAEKYKTIPGFVERYEDLGTKIKSYHALAKIWNGYLEDHQISLEKLETVSTARRVCEKGTLAKYTQMETYAYYCMGDVEKAKDIFENYVLQIVDKTNLKISDVNGLEEEVAVFRQLFKVLPVLNPAWAEFVKTDVSQGFEMEVPVLDCNSVPAIKAYILRAAADICNQGVPMLKKIKALEAKNKGNIDDEVAAKIKWLEETTASYTGDDVVLNNSWKEFTPKNTLAKELDWTLTYCDKVAQIRSYTMNGILHICEKGGEMLKTIEAYQAEHKVELDAETEKKIKYLEEQYNTFNGDLATLNAAWEEFTPENTLAKELDWDVIYCDKVAQIRSYTMDGILHICEKGGKMIKIIDAYQSKHNVKLDAKTKQKTQYLKDEYKTFNGDLSALNAAWKKFTPKNTLAKELDWTLIYCDKVAQIRSYTMNGILHICEKGGEMLKAIEAYQGEHDVKLDAETEKKIKYLEGKFETFNGDLATLNAAWEEFTPKNTLAKELDWNLIYCDKIAQIRSYTMNGILHDCTLGEEMLGKIATVQKESKVTLDATTEKKVDVLKSMVQQTKDDFKLLSSTWTTFIAENDTLPKAVDLATVYCDKIAQVRYWTIEGHLNYCDAKGDEYVAKIDDLTKEHSLKFDKELDCSIERLRNKIWNCKYWKLVLQARKETHEERERFGPSAAKLMYTDLNGPSQPCETTVEYSAVGFIGVKYVITAYLCQNINLAKMGDPEYYKKIATWVDAKVLQKYCASADMRCKEDFFIYLEGHSDGNRFSGARYKKSLGVPQGTPFTHFDQQGVIHNKTTDREITNSLKNNMELGIARAWTVKQQLDFMEVPISIGAFEHPANEKGGQYRRIEIELNIPNLLLDFYELRLKTLWEASGIGECPDTCEY